MFGKKKKTGDEAAEGTTPAKKASQGSSGRKNSLNKGGPNFLALHIEKMILGVIVLVTAYLIYAGAGAEKYPQDRQPEKLAQEADNLLTQIRQDHWPAIAEERQVEHEFARLAEEARRPIDPGKWDSGEIVWEPKPAGSFEKRGDPKIYPPEELVVHNVFGALAVEVPKDAPDPYEGWENAEPIKPKQSTNRRGRGRGRGGEGGFGGEAGYGAGYGAEGYGGMGPATGPGTGMTGPQAVRTLSAKYDLGAPVGKTAMTGGAMGGYGEEGMGYPMGPTMGPTSGPTMGGARGSRDGLGTREERGPTVKVGSQPVIFNAITAIVPHKKMVEEYKAAFAKSGDFVAVRDLPVYLSFELQRADVTDNPSRPVQEQEWKTISNGGMQSMLPQKNPTGKRWAVFPPLARPVPEVIDRSAVSPGLTMPIPPMLIRDYRWFCKHPKIDWIWDAKPLVQAARRAPQKQGDGKEEIDPSSILPGAASSGAGRGAMGPGAAGYGGYGTGGYGAEGYGAGYGMTGGYGAGYGMETAGGYGTEGGSMPGYGGGYGGGYGMEGYGSYGAEGYGAEGMEGYGMSGYGMGGYGAMAGGMGVSPYDRPHPEYKMVRCYDFLPLQQFGKVYRYRVRLILRDPNYPESNRIQAPAPNELKDDVWQRVAKLMAKDQAAKQKNPDAPRSMEFITEWSEPSPPVYVRAPFEVFTGEIDFQGPQVFNVDGRAIAVTTTEPTAKLVAGAMDFSTGAMVPIALERVRRGAVLNDKQDVEVIDPATRVVKKKEDVVVETFATVVDMRGGEKLEVYSNDDPQRAIGEIMVLHRDGRIEVSTEMDDLFYYRMYTFQEEKEAAEKSGQTPYGGMGGYGEFGTEGG
ncbi:MAG: hypothetical protein KatS3mg111_1445 [Pirellulaceae bacterium]|nr:MAG: hypothetical protein KatS3mg111_1445 [Pirellulaceae bacterium]